MLSPSLLQALEEMKGSAKILFATLEGGLPKPPYTPLELKDAQSQLDALREAMEKVDECVGQDLMVTAPITSSVTPIDFERLALDAVAMPSAKELASGWFQRESGLQSAHPTTISKDDSDQWVQG
jgi:hypothetical protein